MAQSSAAYAGTDTENNAAWRTSTAAKTFQIDGSNVYGSAGYSGLDSSAGNITNLPSGVTIQQLSRSAYSGNSGYLQIDNPNGSGTITSGGWYQSGVSGGQVNDFLSFTFSATESFTVGIYTDNQDYSTISPSALRIEQVAGAGSADSGYITNTPSRTGEWFFFNVSGQAGDVFDVLGIATASGNNPPSDEIGMIAVDAENNNSIPEPGSLASLLAGVGGRGIMQRRRRSASLS